ncbi:hypothetical protein ACFE04_022733 [Oxalis oulophora]
MATNEEKWIRMEMKLRSESVLLTSLSLENLQLCGCGVKLSLIDDYKPIATVSHNNNKSSRSKLRLVDKKRLRRGSRYYCYSICFTLRLNNCHCHSGSTHSFCSHTRQNIKENIDLTQFPTERIRNFSIIAHVDHGKSTLADRLLELTGTIKKGIGQPQYLHKLQVERERGITVKAQTATMFYNHQINNNDIPESQKFLLNLIDTPGHVDFSYEVSRSLAACQGALLIVDAAQGVQAQTVANFYLTFDSNFTIIPVINKIDQPTTDIDRVKAQLKSMFDLDPNDCLLTSAKTGQGLQHVLPRVIDRIPPPPGESNSPFRMLLLDSYFDEYKGVICHVAVVDGIRMEGIHHGDINKVTPSEHDVEGPFWLNIHAVMEARS